MAIALYDKFTKQDRFKYNGIGFLRNAIQCYSEKELNGAWELSMTYPITNRDEMWKHLKPWNIIKNTKGQLFVIYKVEKSLLNSGMSISVKARHMFYYLNDKVVYNAVAENFNGYYAIAHIMGNTDFTHENGLTDYEFSYNSDIEITKNINYSDVSVTYALLGAPDSVVNLYGGELYRDNFYFSINKRMENAKDYAFNLVYGYNLAGVKETVDVTDYYSHINGTDNYGNLFGVSWVPSGTFPHHISKSVKFSYNEEVRLEQDVQDYFAQHKDPITGYTVVFDDLKNTNKWCEWAQLQRYDVGDSGIVRAGALDIFTTQKIIKTKYNELKEKMESMTLGNFEPSIIRKDRFTNIAEKSANSTRLDRLETIANTPVEEGGE